VSLGTFRVSVLCVFLIRFILAGVRGSNNIVRMWDCGTGQAVDSPYLGHKLYITSADISSFQAVTIKHIWDLTASKQIGLPIEAGDYIYTTALSYDGHITAGLSKTVCVWDVKTRQRLLSLKLHSAV
jgi:WD40 repeat protein